MISDAIAVYTLIQNIINQSKDVNIKEKIKKAIFDWEGACLDGDKDIKVKKESIDLDYKGAKVSVSNYWVYLLEPIEDYFFVYFPLNPVGILTEHPICIEHSIAKDFPKDYLESENCFRFIQAPNGRIYTKGDLPNIKVKFIVLAYHKSILLDVKGN